MIDVRSALTVQIMQGNPHAYEALMFAGDTPAPARELLQGVQPTQLLGVPVKSPVAASMMLAGLWLWHDGLRECHDIVQKSAEQLFAEASHAARATKSPLHVVSDQSPGEYRPLTTADAHAADATLAFWHGIMHRREGDFGNAKYWFAKCRNHPLMPTLASLANDIIAQAPADKALLKLTLRPWDGSTYVDLVQEVHESPSDPRYPLAIALQQMEWRTLFDYCAREAAK